MSTLGLFGLGDVTPFPARRGKARWSSWSRRLRLHSARRMRKSEVRRTNDESSSKTQFAACGLRLVASRFSDR